MSEPNLAIFCKSYAGDLTRFGRLWESIEKHNHDRLPVYVSVPESEQQLFQQHIGRPDGLTWLTDEEIVDSESEFLRDFGFPDFVHPSGAPYTVMHQNKELLQLAADKGITKVMRENAAEADRGREIFGRAGPDYAFGPTPVIWSKAVWQDLDEKYLEPRGWTLWDAIESFPSELHWYGEALLHYRSIPLQPVGPLFRVYHYNWQWHAMRRLGETPEKLKANYLGMLRQSNWDYSRDSGLGDRRKSPASRLLRAFKHFLARFR